MKKLKIIFIFILIIIGALNVYNVESIRYDNFILISNFIIIIVSLLFMWKADRYNYSLNKIFYLFSFFFFGISPAVEFQFNRNYWRSSNISNEMYLKMNFIILMIIFLYQFLYYIFHKKQLLFFERKIIRYFNRKLIFNLKTKIKFLILMALCVGLILIQNKFDFKNLLLRGGNGIERMELSLSTNLILTKFLKPITAILLIYFKSQKIESKFFEIMLIIALLITNFPTGSARFYIAAIYIPILIIYIKQMRKKLALNNFLIIGLLFIFPILDEMRKFKDVSQIKFGFKFKMFLEGHFDSYQNFLRVVDNEIITWGNQLLTSLLFFIPRSIWENKSLGSGSFLAQKIGLSFSNIALNFFGEGYINFGFWGIILFVFSIAWFNSRFDKIYWRNIKKNSNYLSIFYLLMLGMEFFILRGDFLSSFSYTVGMMSSAFVIYFITR